ncbi:hypothetical protein ACSBR2_014754 [Camellia fascicularis]
MSLKELVSSKRSSRIEFNGREFDVSRPRETDENVVTIQKTTTMPSMETENSHVLRAEEIKLLANETFKAHKYSQAIDLYTQAIELHSENAVYWANRAITYARLEENGSVIQDMVVQYKMHQGLLKLIPNIRRHALQSETFSGKSVAIYACAKEQDFLVIEVMVASVTCFTGITSSLFSSLPKEKQDFIFTSSVNAALNDEFSSVRSAACRAFGVITCFPQIAQSAEILGKFIHAADINTRDPLVLVRITASWALANICDSLHHCINVVTSKRCFVDLKVASHLIVLLIECSLPLSKDSYKVMIKELKMLYDDSRSNSCIEHATGIIEEKKAQENLSKKISTISLTGADIGAYC